MKTSFIVPCRNKAKYVADTVKSVLAQTYSPMEIVLSDQGSVDGSFEIMSDLAARYNGPNKVRVLQCPHTEFKGMAGLNLHLNWLHGQIEGDNVIMCSADDLNHTDRALHTVKAFEDNTPSYVGTCVEYWDKNLKFHGETTKRKEDGFVDPVENLVTLLGSNASSAWSRDLYEKYGPLKGVEAQDITLPFFATLERGLYYVSKPLHVYVKRADADNTGMQGVLLSAKTQEEKYALTETCNYHFTSHFIKLLSKAKEKKVNLSAEVLTAVVDKIVYGANLWTIARDNLTMRRIPPIGMKV